MNKISLLLLRLGIGISFFGHGLVRLPKLNSFTNWMITSFEKSYLPKAIVLPFSYALPVLEFLIGLLIIIGILKRISLIAGAIVSLILMIGTCLLENWEALPSQMIHLAFFAILLHFAAEEEVSKKLFSN